MSKLLYFLLGVIIINCHRSVTQAANTISINPQGMTQSLAIQGTSGGSIVAQEVAQTKNTATGFCNGYVNSQPNHLLNIESFAPYLRLEIASDADTTIIIKGPGGVWCNDDSDDANPMIEGQWQSGLYQVWVGSYQVNSSHDYQIRINSR
ncbi:MAG: hypothetical protein AAGE84_22260 [Cyanobacteria bacterium P01_G01_bin.39]